VTPTLPTPELPTPELSTRLPLGQSARWSVQRSAQVADAAVVEAARVLLAQMGVTVDDLRNAAPARPPCPTFTEYVPRVAASCSAATRPSYAAYWDTLCARWGERRIDEPTTSELAELVEFAAARRRMRGNDRGGYGTRRQMVTALRRVYRCAEDDGLITMDQNPARRLRKPRPPGSTRRAIPDTQLAEINRLAANTGNDPELDSLLVRFHVETACRRGGTLALRACDRS
jgi:integrase/recombinase XerC